LSGLAYGRAGFVVASLLMAAFPLAAMAQLGQVALVEVEPVVQQEIKAGQELVGTVVPIKTAVIGSAVDGRVIEFPVNEGDRVEAGQTLAQLLTQTIQLELRAAEAELQLRKKELEELQNGLRPEEIEQARAQMEAAKAGQDYMKARRERTESLFRQGRAASEEDRQEAVSASVRALELFNEAVAAHKLAVAGPRQEKKDQADARVKMQQALVDKLRDQLQKHTIVSRFTGYVTTEHTEVGQWVKQGEPVAEVVALDQVDVEAHVVEHYIRFVQIGAPVRVDIPALAEPVLPGSVALVVPQADVRSRTFRVKIRVPNSFADDRPMIKAGMLARVTLPTGAPQEALLVRKDALFLGGGTPIIWVISPGSAEVVPDPNSGTPFNQAPVQPVPVRLGVAADDLIQVIDDVDRLSHKIRPGDLVVVKGNERIAPPQPNQPSLVRWPVSAAAAGSRTD
jgi:RND family efflux transporter MFP subunit